MFKKSPGGSAFPYYYKGGVIHAFKFGSYYADEEKLRGVMQAEEDFVQAQNHRLRMWVDFYDTQWTDALLLEFLESISRMRVRIVRLAIVGCSIKDRWRMTRLSKRQHVGFSVPVRFFQDPEKTKSWLVCEAP